MLLNIRFKDTNLTIAVDKNNRTIWGTQKTISEAFGVSRQNISKHINKLIKLGEINNYDHAQLLVVHDEKNNYDHVSEIPIYDEKNNRNYKTKFYNLNSFLALDYCVSSDKASI